MSNPLVIVESPAKAKTINKYLDGKFDVVASVGHIRDLPKKKLGIDIENGFKPEYVNMRDKSSVIKALKKASSGASTILLATDMDREGEAIAWHISNILEGKNVSIKRIVFNEITKRAIGEAIENPREIDINKVNAQQARRVLDRLVGYLISPVLWNIFYRGLSAGRVQSIGLRLLCEREGAIRAFTPSEYWTIEGQLSTSEGGLLSVKLAKIEGSKPEIKTEKEATAIVDEINDEDLAIGDIKKSDRERHPYPPYITSTMQRDAASRLGFSAKKTMMLAQQLYEGLELGKEGSVGLISYMRTDSTRISDEARNNGQSYILDTFGKDKLSGIKRRKVKKSSVQDAHEAIRPTESFRTPDSVSSFLTKDQLSLYSLIWQRFLASLAKSAVYRLTRVEINAGKYILVANGRETVDKGFLEIMPDRKDEGESMLPKLEVNEKLSIKSLEGIQHFTEPPPRYSESSLIKALEDNGIGRPSTYASILSIIQTRKYATREGKTMLPTELGEKVWMILDELFNDIFEIDFTARLEKKLDEIEESREEWQKVIEDYYRHLESDLESYKERREEAKKLVQEASEEICENCGRKLVKKWSRNGPFLACPGFPECRFTKSLDEEEIDRKCPKCGGKLTLKNGRFGRFIACSNYPDCKYTEPVTIGVKCPKDNCDGDLVEKKTKRGKIFYGCSKYPKCDFASWYKPVAKECPSCGNSILVEKKTKKKGLFLQCPSCKHEVDL